MRYGLVANYEGESIELHNYAKILGFDEVNESKLKDIVEFTNEFDSERDLIDLLIYLDILPKNFSNCSLGIIYYKNRNSEPRLLQYGLSFKKDKKFFDTIFLKYYFCDKLKCTQFMRMFLNKYYTHLIDVQVFTSELTHIRFCYEQFEEYQYLPKDAEDAMTKFIEKYCRKKSKEGYYKADFTRIRDLAMFAVNYERNFTRNQNIKKASTSLHDLEVLKSHYETLLQNDTLTEEEIEHYTCAISNIDKQLRLDNLNLSRRM